MYLWQQRSPSLLSFYRPNQSNYAGYPGLTGLGAPPVLSIAQMKAVRPLSGMGDDVSMDPKLLLSGIGLLAAAVFVLGTKKGPVLRARRAARLRRKLKALEG